MPASALAHGDDQVSWRPSPLLRLAVWWHRWSLDRRLSDGEEPTGTAQLEWRATQFLSRASRERLAVGVERVVDMAEVPAQGFSSAVPLCRDAIRASQALLLSLARDLRSGDPVRPQGVARTRLLLSDGISPLYEPCDDDPLREAVEEARSGLSWT